MCVTAQLNTLGNIHCSDTKLMYGVTVDGGLFLKVQYLNGNRMREIKFRAWLKDLKEMRQVGCVAIQHESIYLYSGEFLLFKDIELMQFTGLHDKNGKEIYEGDILKTYGGQILTVEIDDLIHGDSKFHCILIGEAEILGNIYENPELLK